MGIKRQTEKGFMETVVQLAKLQGWLVYHTYDSRKSEPGFPDLVMVRDNRIIFAELKLEKGVMTPAQWTWREKLLAVSGGDRPVEVYIWRPDDWNQIQRTLQK